MVLEKPILPFLEWLALQVNPFVQMLIAAILLALFVAFLATSLRHGPFEALRMISRTLWMGCTELLQISPRRMMAIAQLAFQESIRRRVLIVFAIFAVGLLFGGWFLDPEADHPGRLYLSFVLTSTNYLVLILAVMLSAFSLPTDIKNRTIYTVVTKPVRGWEVVVGRTLGLTAVATLLLLPMGVISYLFVLRGLQHTHTVDPRDLAPVTQADASGDETDPQRVIERGLSTRRQYHRHEVEHRADGSLRVIPTREHTHDVVQSPAEGGKGVWTLGPAKGYLVARVPVMGDLWFLDRAGKPSVQLDARTGAAIRGRGINVGTESKYRSYIEGGTLGAAVWRFRGLRAEDYPADKIPLEMSLRVFRTHKGIIEKGITGTIQLVKPAPLGPLGVPNEDQLDGGLRSIELSFTADDDEIYQPSVPRKILARDAQGIEREVDVFEDLVDPETGELEIWVRCLDKAQFLGMAPADLYLRNRNQPVWLNFAKAFLGIWMQMVVVTCFGVTFSTFLSGPVAMVATATAIVMGFFKGTVFEVSTGAIPGGGPVESLVRLVLQQNQMSDLEVPGTAVIKQFDAILMLLVRTASSAMPNCGEFNTSRFVAYGFDVPPDLMGQQVVTMLAYLLVVSAAGYFFFKTREVAA